VPFEAIRQIVGLSHLLCGSDFPFWHPEVTSAGLGALMFSADDLRAIERDNALALLPQSSE
jgi:predicted TIM-barrel fold metal-dependent hydrolase